MLERCSRRRVKNLLIQEELDSIGAKEVKIDVDQDEIYENYQSKGIRPVKMPGNSPDPEASS